MAKDEAEKKLKIWETRVTQAWFTSTETPPAQKPTPPTDA